MKKKTGVLCNICMSTLHTCVPQHQVFMYFICMAAAQNCKLRQSRQSLTLEVGPYPGIISDQ